MAHRTYTEEDQARAAITLIVNDGNIKRTARELLMPVSTVRLWKEKWEREGYPDLEATPPPPEDMLSKMERLHDRSMDLLEDRVRIKDISSRDLVGVVKILSEKISMIKGLPSQRTETVHTFPSVSELQNALKLYIGEIVDSAHTRQEEIIDAVAEEETPLPLTKGE